MAFLKPKISMSNTFDFTERRIKKILADKDNIQSALSQLLQDMRSAQQSHSLIESFSLKCFGIQDKDELFVVLDDFFMSEIQVEWHLHYPVGRLHHQLSHKVSSYSEAMARKYISHAVIEGQRDYTELSEKAVKWLFSKEAQFSRIKIIPLGSNLNCGFMALAQTESSIALNASAYAFIGKACQCLFSRSLA